VECTIRKSEIKYFKLADCTICNIFSYTFIIRIVQSTVTEIFLMNCADYTIPKCETKFHDLQFIEKKFNNCGLYNW